MLPVRENSIIYNSKYAIAQLIKKHLSNKYTNSLYCHPEPAKKLTKDLKKTLKTAKKNLYPIIASKI
jgi:hypothetical protein